MRMLYVIDSLAPGGAETSLAAMAPGLVASGIDLHVLALGSTLDLAPLLVDAGVTLHKRTGRPGRIGNLRAILRTAGRLQPDLIHTTLFEADVAGRTAARLLGIPSSTSLVNEYYSASQASEAPPLKLRAARSVDRTTAQFASRFHAVSGAVAESVGPVLRIRRDSMDVIPRGRDPQRFRFRPTEARRATREALAIDPETPVVLAVGRQEPQKGLQYLLAAVPFIAVSLPGTVVLLAGRDGRSSNRLREQTAGLPLDIRFLGHRTDMPELMAAADVLAFPSEREGSPGTLIEAMAVGAPIVASDIAPCLEVLGGNDPPVALVTPVGDHAALGKAVALALNDSENTRQRAIAARARFERLYTIDSVAGQMANFFSRAAQPAPLNHALSNPSHPREYS